MRKSKKIKALNWVDARVIVRRLFTGETIRTAAGVGWSRDLTVQKMMRENVQVVYAGTIVAAFVETFPLGSQAYVVAVDEIDRYAGLIFVADIHAAKSLSDVPIKNILHFPEEMLLPGMVIKEAVFTFDRAEAETLCGRRFISRSTRRRTAD